MKYSNASWLRVQLNRAATITAVILATLSVSANAFEVDVAGKTIKIDNLLTIGGMMRMQDRDGQLVGKSSLNPGICARRTSPDPYNVNPAYAGHTCNAGEDAPGYANANAFFVDQPGSYSPNGDDGNLNFDKHDIVSTTFKLTTDFSLEVGGYNIFVRALGYADPRYLRLQESHPDTTAQARYTAYRGEPRRLNGLRFEMLDYFVSKNFDIGDRAFSIKVGNQVLNWGESSFLLANSLNSINPPDQAALRMPGFDLKELAQPAGMVLFSGDIVDGVSFQTFYQYKWVPVIPDPVGSYFSTSDIVGAGGDYAMLSFAKAPEDPEQLYEPARNPDDPAFIINSKSSRTLLVDHAASRRAEPKNGGQYGAAFKFYLEGLNGTEVGLYFANYHARIPSISGYAANATCLPNSGVTPVDTILQIAVNCLSDLSEVPSALAALANGAPQIPLDKEALPLDSARLFIEYPENVKMYGVSFNTTVGDIALAGEYVYRPNLPGQIHSTDLVFALLQPAFPEQDLNLGIATLPGRRSAAPDFLTQYRNPGCAPNCVTAGQYIRGYEPMKIGQLNLSLLKTIGGDNPLGASQITLLLESGFTHIIDFPDLSELQFNGAGTDSHISSGADGSIGINPRDVRTNPNDPSTSKTDGNLTVRQNPTAWKDHGGFGTKYSYGYRFVTLTRYDSALFGANLEFLNALFHDVRGVGPGLGQNFVGGRKQILSGIRIDYLSRVFGEVRYTWFTGGGVRDAQRDRDNLMIYGGYQF
ncbi:DUF1302 domain-containing protein [Stenotrophobium rhamnosiphilum]|uniref:DUF1302 domain-containing protein n=1 Tax=Stenotrophobium rhamnosiphilum TaxID=2029166 RepID=A0A2T5MDQ9_9GAMM|nr:DUF1302 family protein [Stenotrophobium rhamnosiphilum]PTU30718.1 hypothetical protein CJD38_14605 [Stenotrophobium rhamnosiphilum]